MSWIIFNVVIQKRAQCVLSRILYIIYLLIFLYIQIPKIKWEKIVMKKKVVDNVAQ